MTLGKEGKDNCSSFLHAHVDISSIIPFSVPFCHHYSVINGVKDMDGFRHTMNLTLVEQSNGSRNCAGNDANENALLVSGGRGCCVDDREGASGGGGRREMNATPI